MEKLGIYDYVAVIVPGVAFLFGLGVMLPESGVHAAILLPHDLGSATVHLVLAFALGHMLQVIGQLLHYFYWIDYGGLPTDWPMSRDHPELSPDLRRLVVGVAGEKDVRDLVSWRRAVSTARSLVTADGFAARLEVFHANYGMFRSICVAGLLLLCISPWGQLNLWATWSVLSAVMVVSLIGMHRFGVHYARELFSAIRAWNQSRSEPDGRASVHWNSTPGNSARPNTVSLRRRVADRANSG